MGNLTETTFQIEADKLMIGCAFLADVELSAIVESVSRAHSVALILDPTAYNKALHSGHMDDAAQLARLALKLVAAYLETKGILLPEKQGEEPHG